MMTKIFFVVIESTEQFWNFAAFFCRRCKTSISLHWYVLWDVANNISESFAWKTPTYRNRKFYGVFWVTFSCSLPKATRCSEDICALRKCLPGKTHFWSISMPLNKGISSPSSRSRLYRGSVGAVTLATLELGFSTWITLQVLRQRSFDLT